MLHATFVLKVEHAISLAPGIGFPIIMKASAGGGGKGMRVIWKMEELEEGYNMAKAEAVSTVGDDTMMMQHFVCPHKGRHIEIQVLADKHGNCVYLNERECSVQRRHQKVIEEAPSPLVTPEMRKQMGEQAVALCKHVGYVGAGTVEFLVDPDLMKWYFLEMNTRLQVEHPITEHITGVDIVEEMIRVAAGKPLSVEQDDIGINGWAFEARVYAEDPANNFRPGSGPLEYLRTPECGSDGDFTVRVDTGVEQGDHVTVFYDPMICKLIVHGPDRASALAKLREALREYNIAGLRTNIEFVHDIAEHPDFMSGDYTTTFIEENEDYLFGARTAPASRVAQAALSIILHEQTAGGAAQTTTADGSSPWAGGSGLRLNTTQTRTIALVDPAEQEYEVEVTYGALRLWDLQLYSCMMQLTSCFLSLALSLTNRSCQ
jgi:acetyl/propionyl-CoA carboxylase alpha subunit